MIRGLIFVAIMLAGIAKAQQYPSPTYNKLTITGTGSTGDVSEMSATANSLKKTIAAWLAGSASRTGTTSPANVVTGTSDGFGVQDSGNQLIKTGVATADPGASNDSGQGYSVGSTWINTASNTIWIASSVTPGNAVWAKAIGLSPYTSIGTVFGSTPANTTQYAAVGGTGANQNTENPMSQGGTISNLYVRVGVAPDVGNNYVFTIYTGAATVLSATAITCTIPESSLSCSDLVHTASISQGQFWALQVVNNSSSVATATSSMSIKVLFQ